MIIMTGERDEGVSLRRFFDACKARKEEAMGKLWVVCVLAATMNSTVCGDVFNMGGVRNPDGSWTGLASLETVHVGNAGNAGELSGSGVGGYGPDRVCGAVAYEYNIGKYEVTAGQYVEFLNAVAATDTYGLYTALMGSGRYGSKIERSGSSGSYTYSVAIDWANRPVNYVNWGDTARFVNWLHNGQPTGAQGLGTTEDGAYSLNGATGDSALLAVIRESDATWVIPSEDEWYKAAYHKNDGVTGNYFDYPTSSDNIPSHDLIDPDPGNNGNFVYQGDCTSGSNRTEVGEFENSVSPYGTFDQGGNVWEWNEAVLYGSARGLRGGGYKTSSPSLLASGRVYDGSPTVQYFPIGFRVAQVPEPATMMLLALGTLAMVKRKRR